MKIKHLLFLGILMLGLCSCKNSEKHPDAITIVKNYYEALDASNFNTMKELLADSITSKEMDYQITFSQKDYETFIQWDAVFAPTYTVLEIYAAEGSVKGKISKSGKRTLFLNGEAVITNEVIHLRDGKIHTIEISDYVVFHNEKWNAKRTLFLNWIDQNHPELNDFIHDQTKNGALKYKAAIDYYEENN